MEKKTQRCPSVLKELGMAELCVSCVFFFFFSIRSCLVNNLLCASLTTRLRVDYITSNPGSSTNWLCDLGSTMQLPCALQEGRDDKSNSYMKTASRSNWLTVKCSLSLTYFYFI